MMEVAVQNGRVVEEQDKAAKLEDLAEEMNRQFVACGLALNKALDHALEVGRLLDEAKTILRHTEYTAWVVANFAGSDRTARSYRRLWVNREKIEAKRKSTAILSIADALHFLKQLEPIREPKFWQPDWAIDAQPDPDVLRAWEEDQKAIAEQKHRNQQALARLRMHEKAEEQAKKGDPTKPRTLKVSDEEWSEAYAGAVEWRTKEAGKMIFELLRWLQAETDPDGKGFRAEEVGKGMAYINPPDAGRRNLRDFIGWLQEVLEVAEREQGQQPDKPQGDED